MDSGSRCGSGKPVELFVDEHWDQFREIWGGSPATTLPEGIFSFNIDPVLEGMESNHGHEERTSALEDDAEVVHPSTGHAILSTDTKRTVTEGKWTVGLFSRKLIFFRELLFFSLAIRKYTLFFIRN